MDKLTYSNERFSDALGHVHHCTPETKQQSKQWMDTDGSGNVPNKEKTLPLGVKSWWLLGGGGGIRTGSAHKLSKKSTTINGEYQAALLEQDAIKTSHTLSTVTKLLYTPYWPDLALCVNFLFPGLKKWFVGEKFGGQIRRSSVRKTVSLGSLKNFIILKVGKSVFRWMRTKLKNEKEMSEITCYVCQAANYPRMWSSQLVWIYY